MMDNEIPGINSSLSQYLVGVNELILHVKFAFNGYQNHFRVVLSDHLRLLSNIVGVINET